MTPTRGKRNSKVPERFSSDDLRIETSNTNGITILDYNDKTTSTTHRLAPIGTKIKLKPALREPLKVKLPKLKRPPPDTPNQKKAKMRTTNSPIEEDSSSGNNDSFACKPEKVNKIKLPSLASRTNSSSNELSKKQNPQVVSYNSYIDQTQPSNEDPPKSKQSKVISKPKQAGISPSPNANPHDKPYSLPDEQFNSSSSSDNMSASEIVAGNKSHEEMLSLDINSNDSGIRCPCGVDADLGVMVECEKCSTWQHGHCINVGPEEDAYEGYICAFCLFPAGKHGLSLHQLTVGDRFEEKFNKLSEISATDRNDTNKLNNENRIKFSMDELVETTRDLKRTSNSLDVKWKLYLNQEYPAELKIWTNALWSEDSQENLKQQQRTGCFIGDINRSNLELNIRNMIRKMTTRISLIRIQMSNYTLDRSNMSELDAQKAEQTTKLLNEISDLVEKVRTSLSPGT